MKRLDAILRTFMMLPHRFNDIIPIDNSSILAGQQFYIYFYGTLLICFGVSINIAGLSGPDDTLIKLMNIANLTICITTFVLYCRKTVNTTRALITILLSSCLETSAEVVLCAFNPTPFNIMVSLGNLALSILLITFATVAYIPAMPTILGLTTISAYAFCVIFSGNSTLSNFFLLFFAVFLIACVLSECLIRQGRSLLEDNAKLRADEYELMSLLKINKRQVKAFVDFSKIKNASAKDTERLLSYLSDGMRRKLITGIKEYLNEREYDLDRISAAMPELSPSEKKICLCILQDKKLGEICRALDKTENNVNAQRSHIRSKLGVAPGENLKEALEKRIMLYKENL